MDRRSWLKLSLSGTAALILGTEAPAILLRKEPPKGFRTGLEAIDDYVGCWDRGDLITFMGTIGAGKTAIAQRIATANAEDGHKVIVLADKDELGRWNQISSPNLIVKCMPVFDRAIDFGSFLYQQKADLLIMDCEFPVINEFEFRYVKLYVARVIAKYAFDLNCSVALTLTTLSKMQWASSVEPIINSNSISFTSSRIFKITKYGSLSEVKLVKNRDGGRNISFYYRHVLNKGIILPVSVPWWQINTYELNKLNTWDTWYGK